jgi:DNA-binding cell septation regulator SpoVG
LDKNSPNTFHIYDRQTGEIIFKRVTPGSSNFRYQYFNTSNKIAFAEEVQLPGDDKVYSYIRIFDPDSRTIVKDIRVESNYGFFISMDDKKLIYRQGSYNEVYDIENSKYLSYSHYTIHNGIILFDTNILYCYSNTVGISANRLDWTVGIDSRFEQKDTTIYPNPTNGMVSINITPEFVLGIWNVSDLQGRILKKGLIGHASTLEINIAGLVPGTYYLTLTNKDSKSSYKLIKQ